VLTIDRHQDYDLDRVHVTSAGSLLVEFHRLYDTCDTDDYLIDVSIHAPLLASPHQHAAISGCLYVRRNLAHDKNATKKQGADYVYSAVVNQLEFGSAVASARVAYLRQFLARACPSHFLACHTH